MFNRKDTQPMYSCSFKIPYSLYIHTYIHITEIVLSYYYKELVNKSNKIVLQYKKILECKNTLYKKKKTRHKIKSIQHKSRHLETFEVNKIL